MRLHIFKIVSVVWLLLASSPGIGRAQYAGPGEGAYDPTSARETISATGNVTLKSPPTALRLHVELLARGATLQDALDKMKLRRQAVTAQLETLAADKASVAFGAPSLSNMQTEQRRRFEAMIQERIIARGREVPKGLQIPKSVAVSMSLKAEWPLQADTPEALLMAVESLQERIRAADLGGIQDAQAASPEEAELEEEMAAMMSDMGEEQIPIGQPQFLYVARISEGQRDQAMAEAFSKAKAQAAVLARAAGIQLGPLVGLSGQGGGKFDYGEDAYSGYGYARMEYLQRVMGGFAVDESGRIPDEAVATTPESLGFLFWVHASFRIQP